MNLTDLIYKYYHELNETDFGIWYYIKNNREECLNLSIHDIALNCSVSHTTILRFAKKIGLAGFSELKVYLKWEAENQMEFDDDCIENTIFEYRETLRRMKEKDCDKIFQLIDQANRLCVYGSGEVQKHAAKELKRIFMHRQKLIHVVEGTTEAITLANSLSESDVFFIISLSGNNPFIINFVKKLKARGIKVISITKFGSNELQKLSDEHLSFQHHYVYTGYHADRYTSTAHFFLLTDMLFLKYLEYKKRVEKVESSKLESLRG